MVDLQSGDKDRSFLMYVLPPIPPDVEVGSRGDLSEATIHSLFKCARPTVRSRPARLLFAPIR